MQNTAEQRNRRKYNVFVPPDSAQPKMGNGLETEQLPKSAENGILACGQPKTILGHYMQISSLLRRFSLDCFFKGGFAKVSKVY